MASIALDLQSSVAEPVEDMKTYKNMTDKGKRMAAALIESLLINYFIPCEKGKKRNYAAQKKVFDGVKAQFLLDM